MLISGNTVQLRLVHDSQNTLVWVYPPRRKKKKGRGQKKREVEIHKSLQKLSFIHQARIQSTSFASSSISRIKRVLESGGKSLRVRVGQEFGSS